MTTPYTYDINQEKNVLQTDSVFLVFLKVDIPGAATPVFVVANTEDIKWNGHTWIAFPFELDAIDESNGGDAPTFNIKVSNVDRVFDQYLMSYDLWLKDNNHAYITVTIYVVNSYSLVEPYTIASTSELSLTIVVNETIDTDLVAAGTLMIDERTYHYNSYSGSTFYVTTDPTGETVGADIFAPVIRPEVKYNVDVISYELNQEWATFTMGPQNLYNYTFPKNTYQANSCRWIFKSEECGYGGSDTSCGKTLLDCKDKDEYDENGVCTLCQHERFGGFYAIDNKIHATVRLT